MVFTNTQEELQHYCAENEYISLNMIESFSQRLEQEKKGKTLSKALREHIRGQCPDCGAAGAFKWHFLGQLKHPECGSWYVGHGIYLRRQLRAVLKESVGATLGSRGGCLEAIFSFFLVITIGIPLIVLLIPTRAIASFMQSKAKAKS